MATLSGDTIFEIFRWLRRTGVREGRDEFRWLLLRLAGQHHLRRPLCLLTPTQLFDRGEDAFVCSEHCSGRQAELSALALRVGHVGACRRLRVAETLPFYKNCSTIETACSQGHSELVVWLAENLNMRREEVVDFPGAFYLICMHGYLEAAKVLAGRFAMGQEDVTEDWDPFVLAADRGHLDLVQWLADHFRLTNTTFDRESLYEAFRWACENGHLEMVRWLADHFNLNPVVYGNLAWTYISAHAFWERHLEVVRFLEAHFGITPAGCERLAGGGRLVTRTVTQGGARHFRQETRYLPDW